MKKTCSCCHTEKPVSEFYSVKKEKDGHDYYCKACRLKTSRESLHRRNRNGPPCKNCGERGNYYASGRCHTCYNYKNRTGKERPTQDAYTKLVLEWAHRVIYYDDSPAFLEKEYDQKANVIRRALIGRGTSKFYLHAYSLLPDDMKRRLHFKLLKYLHEEDVRRIRSLYGSGMFTLKDLGNMYNIHLSAVSRIVNRLTYKYVA
jgi:hypothetical protein